MEYEVFSIPARGDARAAEELKQFLANHAVATVERRFVEAGDQSYWSFCVVYQSPRDTARAAGQTVPVRHGKIDYRDVLSPEDFAIFSRLRDLRRAMASADGVPPFHLFDNAQLAAIVTERVTTKAALGAIDGVGPVRVEKYGDKFLELMREWVASNGGPAEGVSADAVSSAPGEAIEGDRAS